MPYVDEYGRVIDPDANDPIALAARGQAPPPPNWQQQQANQAQQLFNLQQANQGQPFAQAPPPLPTELRLPAYTTPAQHLANLAENYQAQKNAISPTESTFREDVGQLLTGDQRASPERQRFVGGLVGTTGTKGSEQFSVADLSGAGTVLLEGGNLAKEAYKHGKADLDAAREIVTQVAPVGKLAAVGKALVAAKPAIFLGVGAKTADLAALSKAKQLLEAGEGPSVIKEATGWEIGADKKWRFEVSDKDVQYRPPTSSSGDAPLGEVLPHPAVEAAYPGIGEAISTRRNIGQRGGSYNPAKDEIQYGSPGRPYPGTQPGEAERSTLLHELQHAVQEREGFARGGSPSTSFSSGGPGWPVYFERRKAMQTPMTREEFAASGHEGPGFTYTDYLTGHGESLNNPETARMLDRAAQDYAAREGYERRAGEVEARNVQHRMDWDEQRRRDTPAVYSEDRPRDVQFLRRDEPGEQLSTEQQVRAATIQAAAEQQRLTEKGDLSVIKYRRPQEAMSATREPTTPLAPSMTLDPQKLEGSVLIPATGDPTMAGQRLTHINENPLAWPVSLEGGPGFFRSPSGSVWASGQSRITGLDKHAMETARETQKPVNLVYTGMGGRSGDFSHMNADALLAQFPGAKIKRADLAEFDEVMRAQHPDWPGLVPKRGTSAEEQTLRVRDALLKSAGPMRTSFVKEMDKARFANKGFPDVASTRYATTDPAMLGQPIGATGLAVARLPGTSTAIRNPAAPHTTYPAQLGGTYIGGLEQQLPRDLIFPDWYARQRALAPNRPSSQVDYIWDKSKVRQDANAEWLERVMRRLEQQRARGE